VPEKELKEAKEKELKEKELKEKEEKKKQEKERMFIEKKEKERLAKAKLLKKELREIRKQGELSLEQANQKIREQEATLNEIKELLDLNDLRALLNRREESSTTSDNINNNNNNNKMCASSDDGSARSGEVKITAYEAFKIEYWKHFGVQAPKGIWAKLNKTEVEYYESIAAVMNDE
jgi:hypothetical protein